MWAVRVPAHHLTPLRGLLTRATLRQSFTRTAASLTRISGLALFTTKDIFTLDAP